MKVRQPSSRLGVIMGQSETIRKVSFTLVLLAGFTLAVTSGAWAQSNLAVPAPQAPSAPSTTEQSGVSLLTIGGGDLLKVSVFGAPESDQEVRVDQDGNLSLNFIGSVHVA